MKRKTSECSTMATGKPSQPQRTWTNASLSKTVLVNRGSVRTAVLRTLLERLNASVSMKKSQSSTCQRESATSVEKPLDRRPETADVLSNCKASVSAFADRWETLNSVPYRLFSSYNARSELHAYIGVWNGWLSKERP